MKPDRFVFNSLALCFPLFSWWNHKNGKQVSIVAELSTQSLARRVSFIFISWFFVDPPSTNFTSVSFLIPKLLIFLFERPWLFSPCNFVCVKQKDFVYKVVYRNTRKIQKATFSIGWTRYCDLWIKSAACFLIRYFLDNREWLSVFLTIILDTFFILMLSMPRKSDSGIVFLSVKCFMERNKDADSVFDCVLCFQQRSSRLFRFCNISFWSFCWKVLTVAFGIIIFVKEKQFCCSWVLFWKQT